MAEAFVCPGPSPAQEGTIRVNLETGEGPGPALSVLESHSHRDSSMISTISEMTGEDGLVESAVSLILLLSTTMNPIRIPESRRGDELYESHAREVIQWVGSYIVASYLLRVAQDLEERDIDHIAECSKCRDSDGELSIPQHQAMLARDIADEAARSAYPEIILMKITPRTALSLCHHMLLLAEAETGTPVEEFISNARGVLAHRIQTK